MKLSDRKSWYLSPFIATTKPIVEGSHAVREKTIGYSFSKSCRIKHEPAPLAVWSNGCSRPPPREEQGRLAAACTGPAGARTWWAGASRGARLEAASAVPSGSPDCVSPRTAAGAVRPSWGGRKG